MIRPTTVSTRIPLALLLTLVTVDGHAYPLPFGAIFAERLGAVVTHRARLSLAR
jgi:hypothetical protein